MKVRVFSVNYGIVSGKSHETLGLLDDLVLPVIFVGLLDSLSFSVKKKLLTAVFFNQKI